MHVQTHRIVALLGLVIVAAGCKSTPKSTPETRAMVASAPDWYTNPPKSDKVYYAAVTAESKDMQLAVDKAKAAARAEIAQQIEVKFAGMTKRFQEETGLGSDAELLGQFTQSYKLVVSQELNGTRAKEQKVIPGDGVYRAFLLMEMAGGEANKALLVKLSAQQALYTRFRATQGYKEMNDEVEKYEQSKKP